MSLLWFPGAFARIAAILRHCLQVTCALTSCLPTAAQDLAVESVPLPALSGVRITSIVESRDDRLWFGGPAGLWVHDGQRLVEVPVPGDEAGVRRVRALAPDQRGSLWVACDRGVVHVPALGLEVEAVAATASLVVVAIECDGAETCWLRTEQGLHRYQPRTGLLAAVELPFEGGWAVGGFAVDGGRLWLWNERGVWQRSTVESTPWSWVAELSLQSGRAEGEELIGLGDEGLVAIASDGRQRWIVRGQGGLDIRRHGDVSWMRHAGDLWRHDPRPGAGLQRVVFARDDNVLERQSVQALCVDSDGIVWLATTLGVVRVALVPGIDNVLLQGLDQGERANALAEAPDGSVFLATNRGRIWSLSPQDDCRWTPVPVAWERNEALTALAFDGRGRLWAGSRHMGLWCRQSEGWRRIDAPEDDLRVRDLLAVGPHLWVAGNRAVLRLDEHDRIHVVEVQWAADGAKLLTENLCCDRRGTVWLGCFRNGIMRHDPTTDRFLPVTLANGRVLGLAASPVEDRLIAATTHERWGIDLDTGLAQRFPVLGRSAFRDLRMAQDGTMWETLFHQLGSVEGQQPREIGPSNGAHPLGYAFGSGLTMRSGEVWFGAQRGYTRIRRGATLAASERTRVRGVEVTDIGRSAAPTMQPFQARFEVSTSFRLTPQIIDRSVDLPVAYRVQLCSRRLPQPIETDGVFERVPPGHYHARLEFLGSSGRLHRVELAGIEVVAMRPAWLGYLVGAALLTLLSTATMWWFLRHRSEPRLNAVGAAIARLGDRADEVLDVAFVVVAAAERCLPAARAQHVSVWMQIDDQPYAQLASFGAACPAGARRLLANHASPRGPGGEPGDEAVGGTRLRGPDLVVDLPCSAQVSFAVLIGNAALSRERGEAAVEAALAPARSALGRRLWLERLQDWCVDSSLSLEADLHDLRGSLTALRVGVSELQPGAAPDDALVASLSRATEGLLQSVKRLQQQRTVELTAGDPSPVLYSVVATLRAVAAVRGIALQVEFAEVVHDVEFDPVWLRRALENVIGNAIKYTDDATQVRIHSVLEDGAITWIVADEGPGIPPSDRQRLFLPGVVGKSVPRGGEGRSGLGLWVSRQAVRAMGGRMWIESNEPRGTRVCLRLPRQRQAIRKVE